jgi:predicted Rossmann fold nucleotide-binding protein DprA/Smf involved in DNA uptake
MSAWRALAAPSLRDFRITQPSAPIAARRSSSNLPTRRKAGARARRSRSRGRIGLARGIDAAAHWASLATGTVAVLAGGHNRIYPPENVELAGALLAQGAALSEMPLDQEPRAHDFPRRNRLISGLAVGDERDRIVQLLGPTPVSIDDLVRLAGRSPAVVRIVLLELEVAGRLQRHGGGLVSLV